ncbi:GNAT family N-acetyltransferase, partial [Treponema sp. R80B11-R83G3]
KQHIGAQLVKYCIKEAKDNGKKEIVVWVFEKNINSIQFYEKMGFKIDGKTKSEEKFNENEIRMKIEL